MNNFKEHKGIKKILRHLVEIETKPKRCIYDTPHCLVILTGIQHSINSEYSWSKTGTVSDYFDFIDRFHIELFSALEQTHWFSCMPFTVRFEYPPKWCTYALFDCYMADGQVSRETTAVLAHVLCTIYNHAPVHCAHSCNYFSYIIVLCAIVIMYLKQLSRWKQHKWHIIILQLCFNC